MQQHNENKKEETFPLGVGRPRKDVCLHSGTTSTRRRKVARMGREQQKILAQIPAEGHLQDQLGRTLYWERKGSSPAPLRPRRRTTEKELSCWSHKKSSPPRPKTRFLVSNCGTGGSDEGSDEEAGFSVLAGLWFFSPSRSRKNTTWLGSQVCQSSLSADSPSAAAILSQLLSSLQLLSPPLSSANPRPALHSFCQSSSRQPGNTSQSQGRGEGEASTSGRGASSLVKSRSPNIYSEAKAGRTRSTDHCLLRESFGTA